MRSLKSERAQKLWDQVSNSREIKEENIPNQELINNLNIARLVKGRPHNPKEQVQKIAEDNRAKILMAGVAIAGVSAIVVLVRQGRSPSVAVSIHDPQPDSHRPGPPRPVSVEQLEEILASVTPVQDMRLSEEPPVLDQQLS